jgi:hypothetical protein
MPVTGASVVDTSCHSCAPSRARASPTRVPSSTATRARAHVDLAGGRLGGRHGRRQPGLTVGGIVVNPPSVEPPLGPDTCIAAAGPLCQSDGDAGSIDAPVDLAGGRLGGRHGRQPTGPSPSSANGCRPPPSEGGEPANVERPRMGFLVNLRKKGPSCHLQANSRRRRSSAAVARCGESRAPR